MRYLLFLVFATSAFAQNPEPGRTVHLRLLAFDNTKAPAESFIFDPAAPTPAPGLEAPVKGYLNHEKVTLNMFGNKLVFSKSRNFEDLKNKETKLAQVELPRTGNHFMLIFLPLVGGDVPFKILPLDDSVRGFPLGSYHVINLSQSPVRLTLEKKPYNFKPGQNSVITDPPVQENQHSAMYAFVIANGKLERIGSNLWPHPGKKRSIQIFFDSPTSRRTELRGFRDISPPAPN